jgi:iron(III) transport system substrate-binding protein
MRIRSKIFSIFLLLCLFPGCGNKSNTGNAAGQTEASGVTVSEWARNNKLDVYTETPDELYELARKEGKVVIYSISSRIGRVKESFEKQYPGITAEVYTLGQNENVEKITREYEAGVRNADLIHVKDLEGSIYREKVIPGIFINYYPADICAHIDKKYMEYSMPMYIELLQWYYNGELYDKAPLTSWWEITKPEWKGRIAIHDPMNSIDFMSTLAGFVQHADEFAAEYQRVFGEPIKLSPNCPTAAHELIKRLYDNDFIFFNGSDAVCEAVGTTGQISAPIGYGASSKLRKNETEGWVLAPMNLAPATSLTNQNNLYIVNECPHPNAAKLFLRWMMGETDGQGEGFKPFNTLGGWPIRNDVEPAEGSTELSSIKFWPTDSLYLYDHVPDMIDFWISLRK